MTEQQISSALDQIVTLVGSGKPMDAYEQFYHDDLEKTDLDGITVKGKEANKKILIDALSKITEIRDFSPIGKAVSGSRSFQIWSIDYDHTDHGTVTVIEVAVQDWQDGKIIRERYMA